MIWGVFPLFLQTSISVGNTSEPTSEFQGTFVSFQGRKKFGMRTVLSKFGEPHNIWVPTQKKSEKHHPKELREGKTPKKQKPVPLKKSSLFGTWWLFKNVVKNTATAGEKKTLHIEKLIREFQLPSNQIVLPCT